MISVYQLKSRFQSVLQPCARALVKWNVTPNQITLMALGLSISFGILSSVYFTLIPWIGVILFVRMALNALDGMIARAQDLSSPLGFYLNELGDILSDAFLYFPFALIYPPCFYFVFGIIFLSAICEAVGIMGIAVGNKRRYDGPMGKSDRAFIFSLIGIALSFHVTPFALNCIYLTMICLLILSTTNRIKQALKTV